MQKNSEQFLTCAFRLRTPSTRKKILLDNAIAAYTDAVAQVLSWCEANLDVIVLDGRMMTKKKDNGELVAIDKYNARSVSSAVPSSGKWDFVLPGNLKEAAVMDACSMMASYIELLKVEGQDPSFPNAFNDVGDEYSAALSGFLTLADDLELEKELRSKLLRKPRVPLRPITFLRKRDFSVLVNDDLDQFYLLLRPLPDTAEMERVEFDGNLTDIATGERITGKKKAVLYPLQIGKAGRGWQFFKFILAALDGNATLKAAKLIPLNDGYSLNVSFAFACDKPYTHSAYLGVSKSVLKFLTYAVTGLDGRVLAIDSSPTGLDAVKVAVNARVAEKQRKAQRVSLRDYRGQVQDNVLHNIANYIIDVAKRYRAAVVVESTDPPESKKLGKDKLAAPWRKLVFILQYKSTLAGVPFIGERFSVYATSICPRCGTLAKYVKKEHQYCCATCHLSFFPSESASINIARRAFYRKAEWDKRGGYMAFHLSMRDKAGVLEDIS